MWWRVRTANMHVAAFALLAIAILHSPAVADHPSFPPEQVRTGAEIFARNCSPCHGPRMRDPEGAFNLRAFPHDEHDRFVNSVMRGKNQMPPWGDMLKSEEIEALWAYVVAGEN